MPIIIMPKPAQALVTNNRVRTDVSKNISWKFRSIPLMFEEDKTA